MGKKHRRSRAGHATSLTNGLATNGHRGTRVWRFTVEARSPPPLRARCLLLAATVLEDLQRAPSVIIRGPHSGATRPRPLARRLLVSGSAAPGRENAPVHLVLPRRNPGAVPSRSPEDGAAPSVRQSACACGNTPPGGNVLRFDVGVTHRSVRSITKMPAVISRNTASTRKPENPLPVVVRT